MQGCVLVAEREDDQEDVGEMISASGRDLQGLQRTGMDGEVSYVTHVLQVEDDVSCSSLDRCR